jgi:P-type conjugative transfer protein TrbJ
MQKHRILKGSARSVLAVGVAIGIAAAGFGVSSTANAQWVVVDPTNYVANYMTQLRAVQSNANESQQIQQQLAQIQLQQQNTKSLNQRDWDMAANAMTRLAKVMAEGKGLSVSGKDFNKQFQTMFPGYKSERDFGASYDKWNQSTRDSVLGAMRVANIQVSGTEDEQAALARLRSAVLSTTGQKEAVDAGNQIALNQVRQMQSLRELMVAQMQAEGTHIASQTQAEETRRGAVKEAAKYHDPRKNYQPKGNACMVPPCGR